MIKYLFLLLTAACGVLGGPFDGIDGLLGDDDSGDWLKDILKDDKKKDDILGGNLDIPDEVNPLEVLEKTINITKFLEKNETNPTESEIAILKKLAVEAAKVITKKTKDNTQDKAAAKKKI